MSSTFTSRTVVLGFLFAVGGAALGLAACDDSGDGTGGATSSSTSSGTTKSSSAATMTSGGVTTSGNSSSSGMMPATCGSTIELTVSAVNGGPSTGDVATYRGLFTPGVGDTMATDVLSFEFYGPGFDPSLDGDASGTFDLGMGGDANYATCARCFVMRSDILTMGGKAYFQKSGSVTVDATSDTVNGTFNGTITDLTLIEVDIDPNDFTSTPVPNGECLHFATITAAATPPMLPGAWTCDPMFFNDGGCDCGCAAADTDCIDGTVESCDICDNPMSCSTTACPGTINPTDNSTCTP